MISLPAAPVRDGRTWYVPVDFVGRALAPIFGSRLELRKPSRLILVGDIRMPRVAGARRAARQPDARHARRRAADAAHGRAGRIAPARSASRRTRSTRRCRPRRRPMSLPGHPRRRDAAGRSRSISVRGSPRFGRRISPAPPAPRASWWISSRRRKRRRHREPCTPPPTTSGSAAAWRADGTSAAARPRRRPAGSGRS